MTNLAVMLEIDKIFKDIKLQYWISFGTLLGLYRDKDIIKGDNDIDYSCLSGELLRKHKLLIRALKKKRYKIREISEKKKYKIIATKRGAPLAVGIAGFRAKGKYRIRNKWRIPTKYFGKGTVTYKNHKFPCHSPIKAYLSWVYSNWKVKMPKSKGNKLYTKKVLR